MNWCVLVAEGEGEDASIDVHGPFLSRDEASNYRKTLIDEAFWEDDAEDDWGDDECATIITNMLPPDSGAGVETDD